MSGNGGQCVRYVTEYDVIVSFSDRRTEAFYRGQRITAFSGFARTASRKLDQLDAAHCLGIWHDPAIDWKRHARDWETARNSEKGPEGGNDTRVTGQA